MILEKNLSFLRNHQLLDPTQNENTLLVQKHYKWLNGEQLFSRYSKSMNEEQTFKENKLDWKRFLNYHWIVRNISFFLFLAILAVLYIYNGHFADKTARNINKVSKELKELQYEYKTLKSELMFRSKQSELAKALELYGLKELTFPPVVIQDSILKD